MFIFLQLMGDESALSENRIVRDEWWGTCDWLCFGAFFCGALLERRLLGIISSVFDCANIDR